MSLEATTFTDEALTEWLIPTLRTLNSDRLEYVGLGECVADDTDVVRDALATLDHAFTEGPCKFSLRRVDIIDWAMSLPDDDLDWSDDSVTAFVRKTLPECCARHLVYHTSSMDPL